MNILGLITGIMIFLSPILLFCFGLVMIFKSLDEMQEGDKDISTQYTKEQNKKGKQKEHG